LHKIKLPQHPMLTYNNHNKAATSPIYN